MIRARRGPLVAAAAVLVVAATAYLLVRSLVGTAPAGYPLQTDLHVYRDAVLANTGGIPLYDFRTPDGLAFIYPPFAAILLRPLVWTGPTAADVGWTVLGVGLTVLCVWLLQRRVPTERRSTPAFLVCTGLLLASSVTVLNLQWGQVGVLLTALVLADVLDLVPAPARGFLVGIASAVKLTPLIFVVHLLMTGRYRDAGRAVAGFVLATGAAWLLMPGDSATYWRDTVAHIDGRVALINGPDNQSFFGFLLKFAAVDAERGTARTVWVVGSLVVGVVWLLLLRRVSRRDPTLSVLVTGCVAILVSPISWGHHLHWLFLAGAWLWLRYDGAPRVVGLVTMLLLVVPPIEENMPAQDDPLSVLLVNYRFLLVVVVIVAVWCRAGRDVTTTDRTSALDAGPDGLRDVSPRRRSGHGAPG